MYKYFTAQQAADEATLNKAYRDLQKKFHPDMHSAENSTIDYNKISAEINGEYQKLLFQTKFKSNFTDYSFLDALYVHYNNIPFEHKSEINRFIIKNFNKHIKKSSIIPDFIKDFLQNFIKKHFSDANFSKKEINFFRKVIKFD